MTAPAPRLLDDEELQRQLADLPGVTPCADGSIAVTLRAPTFPEAIRLVQLVADDAEQRDHHPAIDVRWRTVTFGLVTHSAGGVTQLDIELAHVILELARQVDAETVPPATGSGT
ncbi:MAG TPA: 4a-hydroxytetrahydrobiopterin dehydratase [Kineosporiaceae bacterium]